MSTFLANLSRRLSVIFLGIGILSLAIELNYIFPGIRLFGIELTTIQNGFVLFCALFYILRFGLRRWLSPILIAYTVILLMTFTFSSRLPVLSISQVFRSYFAFLLAPYFLYEIKFQKSDIVSILIFVSLLGIINLLVGVILAMVGIHSLINYEIATGAWQLQGSSIPAHLAMLAYVSMLASMTMSSVMGRARYFSVSLVNLIIIILTGERAVLALSIVIIVVYIIYIYSTLGRSRAVKDILLIVMAVVISGAFYLPNMSLRFLRPTGANNPNQLEISSDLSLSTSGRLVAWKFFLKVASENIVFGRGVGAGTVANQGQINQAFNVPHNEYIRLLVDGGVIGLVIVMIAFGITFRELYFKKLNWPVIVFISALVVSFALFAFVDNVLSNQQFAIPFWIILAVFREWY